MTARATPIPCLRRRLLWPALIGIVCGAGSPLPGMASATEALGPSQVASAYALPTSGAAHQTIAIISAYDDPAVAADLAAYTKRFAVPACTAASGCLRVTNQSGAASPLPPADATGTFATESSTGVEVARGICRSCSILLVEASSASKQDLSAAVAAAGRAGATVTTTTVELSQESGDDAAYGAAYSQPHDVVVAATGDTGYNGLISFPSSLPGVLAVGGTQLTLTGPGRYGSERVWSGSTSGCALYGSAGTYQAAFARGLGCGSLRSVPDLVAEADPGVLVRIADAGLSGGPWYDVQGTSVSAPIIAGIIGLAGSAGSGEVSMLYAHARSDPGAFHDITAGAEKGCQAGNKICAAGKGPDGASGLGSPVGLAAFLRSGGAVSASRPALTTPRALRLGRGWTGKLALRNGNPFAVHGSITLQRRVRSGAQARTIVLASARVTLAALGDATPTLTVTAAKRRWLNTHGTTSVTARVSISGPAGRAVTLMRPLSLTAP